MCTWWILHSSQGCVARMATCHHSAYPALRAARALDPRGWCPRDSRAARVRFAKSSLASPPCSGVQDSASWTEVTSNSHLIRIVNSRTSYLSCNSESQYSTNLGAITPNYRGSENQIPTFHCIQSALRILTEAPKTSSSLSDEGQRHWASAREGHSPLASHAPDSGPPG